MRVDNARMVLHLKRCSGNKARMFCSFVESFGKFVLFSFEITINQIMIWREAKKAIYLTLK